MRKVSKVWMLGLIAVIAAATATYWLALKPKEQELSLATLALRRALVGVTEIRIRTGGVCHRVPQLEKTLVILRGKDVETFIEALEVYDPYPYRCLCCGSHTFEFYRGKELVASISLHHWRTLRWHNGPWEGDAPLKPKSLRYLKNLLGFKR